MFKPKIQSLILPAAFFVCCEAATQPSAPYRVIKASGQVLSVLSQRQLKAGDLIKGTDKLSFGSRDAYVHVASSSGRKSIRQVPDSSPRDMQQLMENFLAADRVHKASRGMADEGLDRIIHQMSYDTILILGTGRIAVDSSRIPMKKPAGVLAAWLINGVKSEKQISDYTGFNLGKEFVFGPGAAAPYPKLTVLYMENTGESIFGGVEMLGAFVPVYVDEARLGVELKTIIDPLTAAGWESSRILKEAADYLGAEYAHPLPENVHDWLVAHALLK